MRDYEIKASLKELLRFRQCLYRGEMLTEFSITEPARKRIEIKYTDEFIRNINTAIEALKKRYPMKPKLEIWDNRVPDEQRVYVCPVCGDNFNSGEYESSMECCWSCGQRLDWSDIE